MNTCAICRWMQPYATGKPEEGGECMFDPPVVAVVRNSVVTLRPSVLATDRCSAWDGGPGPWIGGLDDVDAVETYAPIHIVMKDKESR